MRPISSSNFSVILPVAGNVTFTRCSGKSVAKATSDVPNPQTGMMETITGYRKIQDVQLGKPYDPVADRALITWLTQQESDNQPLFSFTVTPVNIDGQNSPISGGSSWTFTDCKVVNYSLPDVDLGSANPSMISITISVNASSNQ
jgi:hypothetical protein